MAITEQPQAPEAPKQPDTKAAESPPRPEETKTPDGGKPGAAGVPAAMPEVSRESDAGNDQADKAIYGNLGARAKNNATAQAGSIGSVINGDGTTIYNNSTIARDPERKFEERFWLDNSGADITWDDADQELASRLAELREHRLLVIRRSSSARPEAEKAVYSLSAGLRSQAADLRRYTAMPDLQFELSSFIFGLDERFKRSIVWFDRTIEPGPVQTLCESEAMFDGLRQSLREADCYMLIIIGRLPAFHGGAVRSNRTKAMAPVWDVGEVETKSVLRLSMDPLENTARFCAALFPGLGVEEFVRLVDRLLPRPPTALTSLGPAPAPAADSRPSSLTRWRMGERDALLNELGIAFRANEPYDGVSATFGYHLKTDGERPGPEDFHAHTPALLIENQPALTDIYLAAQASPQFQQGYRRYLLHMHKSGLWRLEARWLAARYREGRPEAYWHVERLASLLRQAFDYGGEEIVRAMLAELVSEIVGSEQRFLEQLGDRLSEELWHAAIQSGAEPSELADAALKLTGLEGDYAEIQSRLDKFYTLALGLMTHGPSAAAGLEAIVKVLTGQAGVENLLHYSTRFAHTLFLLVPAHKRLADWLWAFPGLLQVYASGAVRGAPPLSEIKVGSSRFGEPAKRKAEAWRIITYCGAVAFESLSHRGADGSLDDSGFESMFGVHRAEKGEITLGEVLARYTALWPRHVGEVVSSLNRLALSLLRREGFKPGDAAEQIARLVGPFRMAMRSEQRLATVDSARAVEIRCRHRYEHSRPGSDKDRRKQLALEFEAARIVVRALTGPVRVAS